MPDRPPPTSYRDEDGRLHPGPRCEGYREHVIGCLPCWRTLRAAHDLGYRWTADYRAVAAAPTFLPEPVDPTKVAPIAMPIAGPGVTRAELARRWHEDEQDERHPLLRLRPQHVGPSAVVVGVLAYLLASLAWWLAAPLLVAMFALLVCAGRRDWLAIDRTPPARLLRR